MTQVIDRIRNRRRCGAIAAAGGIALCLGIAALPADTDAAGLGESYRSGRWEVMLGPQYTFERNLKLEGGTTANIDDAVGLGFQFGYNFNEHFNIGGLFSWTILITRQSSNQVLPIHQRLVLKPDPLRTERSVSWGPFTFSKVVSPPTSTRMSADRTSSRISPPVLRSPDVFGIRGSGTCVESCSQPRAGST